MTTINLKGFYAWYTHDEYIEVSDEVAAELRADKLYELAYQRRVIRNKAQYSLDCDDGIEYSACLSEPTPQELLDRMELFAHLWNTLNSLPEMQVVRPEAHLILGKSYLQVAWEQGVNKSVVWRSVRRGMATMKKTEKVLYESLHLPDFCPWYMRGSFNLSAAKQLMLHHGSLLSAVRERRIEYKLSYDRPAGAGAAFSPFKNILGHFVPRS